MRPGLLTRLLFASYCLEAGMFLLMVPWSPAWDRTVVQLPVPLLAAALRSSFARAALAGFGMVHLIWGVHDLDALWPRGREKTPAATDAAPAEPPSAPERPADSGLEAEAPGAANSGV
ncbi:MAG TPA: hypothetical protein VN851_02600 [Thermoanaerobaculia bacterium]|nr:hypothetical protein [Thermoanaerobaculia bacterium]